MISPALQKTLSQEEISVIQSLQFDTSERDAYETLIIEAAKGNDDFFVSYKEVIASWKYIDAVKRLRTEKSMDLMYYPKGWNPDEKRVV